MYFSLAPCAVEKESNSATQASGRSCWIQATSRRDTTCAPLRERSCVRVRRETGGGGEIDREREREREKEKERERERES